MMVGRDVEFKVEKAPAQARRGGLAAWRGVTVPSRIAPETTPCRTCPLTCAAGEIVCLAGIEGNGQTEFVSALTGLEPDERRARSRSGGRDISRASIRERSVDGHERTSPRTGTSTGWCWTTRWRRTWCSSGTGSRSSSNHGFIRRDKRARLRRAAHRAVRRALLPRGAQTIARSMSGGNQQKAIVRPRAGPGVLPAGGGAADARPGRGRHRVHPQAASCSARDAGKAVLLVSLELDEVMNLSDRILVMYEGPRRRRV